MSEFKLPETFYRWAYQDRAELVRRMAAGEQVARDALFLNFTRHSPTFVSNGPAGLNGSVKGSGFVPKKEYLEETLDAYVEHIRAGQRDGYRQRGLDLLVKHVWGEACADRVDFSLVGSLELAKKHSWQNYLANKEVVLVYYQPPMVSFEVRGRVEIHEEGVYHQFMNAQHDVYHGPNMDRWPSRPAYIVRIDEVYDNSANKTGFGARLL
jgi:hypothetical protein